MFMRRASYKEMALRIYIRGAISRLSAIACGIWWKYKCIRLEYHLMPLISEEIMGIICRLYIPYDGLYSWAVQQPLSTEIPPAHIIGLVRRIAASMTLVFFAHFASWPYLDMS